MESPSPFNIKLVQNSFTSGALLVSLKDATGNPIECQKYDIRVIADNFSDIGTDAIATTVVIKNFTITSTPVSLAIPINADAMGKDASNNAIEAKYKVTIRLYQASLPSSPLSHTAEDRLYYDARVYTISSVLVTSDSFTDSTTSTPVVKASFKITNVVVKRGPNILLSNDPFFTNVVGSQSKIVMSSTALIKDASGNFSNGTQYDLGNLPFNKNNSADTSYNFIMNSDSFNDTNQYTYEVWGYLSLAPQFNFGINIVADNTTVGYVVDNPKIAVSLGDVIGTVSEYPIEITLDNWDYYNSKHMFDSVTLNIYDASGNGLKDASGNVLKDASGNNLIKYTKPSSDFDLIDGKRVLKFTRDELSNATNETPLMDGVDYKFEVSLNFTNDRYKPKFVRSSTVTKQFSDTILPIVSGSAVNSWEKDTNQVDGLVVEFKKTDQFYGSSSRPYNLEGNTKVKAEYRIFNTAGNNWLDWKPLTGGSISQTSITYNYAVNNNTDGVYSVPVYNAGVIRGNSQDPVYIYTKIDDAQAKYSAVQIRLSLITTNAAFRSDSRISALYEVPRVNGTTNYATSTSSTVLSPGRTWFENSYIVVTWFEYVFGNYQVGQALDATADGGTFGNAIVTVTGKNIVNSWGISSYRIYLSVEGGTPSTGWVTNVRLVDKVTFRYHPKPVAHNFANDKPICTSAGDSIAFDVPLTIYPFFKAVVTTSDGGSIADITNPNAYDASWNKSVARTGTGLSYTPLADASFNLLVQYVSIEKSSIYSVQQSMPVQRQGFPSNSFSITSNSCMWDYPNQKIQYALDISANLVTAYRMDGWNMYTSTTDASGNLLKDASGNLLRDASGNLVRDASGNVYTLQQYNKLISGGLTQNVTLKNVNDYPDYKNIAVTFVATRSLYLDQANFDKQVETIGAGLGDTKQAPVTKLPAVLPLIDSSDITLANTVYNVITGGTQYGTLSATYDYPANGLQIIDTNVTPNVETNAVSYSIELPTNNSQLTAFSRSYQIKAKYYSVDNPNDVYSLPVTVTFKTSTSDRNNPVIDTKDSSGNTFIVTYTSGNSGTRIDGYTTMSSRVYAKVEDSNTAAVDISADSGIVDLAQFKGNNVNMYIQDKFTTTFTVEPGAFTKDIYQTIDSPSATFILAANPQIDEASIVVDGTNKVITVNVNNMGTPQLDNVVLAVSQDSTSNENDAGYYALAYFVKATPGFVNILSGSTVGPSLSVSDNGGTGMGKVTTLTFSSINLTNTNPVNVVLFVGNTVEGSDSCAVANKAISYSRNLETTLVDNNLYTITNNVYAVSGVNNSNNNAEFKFTFLLGTNQFPTNSFPQIRVNVTPRSGPYSGSSFGFFDTQIILSNGNYYAIITGQAITDPVFLNGYIIAVTLSSYMNYNDIYWNSDSPYKPITLVIT